MSSRREARGVALAALAVVASACGDASGPTGPLTVEILSPAAGDTALRFDTLSLRASVRDAAGREVEDEAVDWFIGTGRVLGHGASTSVVVGDTGDVLVTARAGVATSSVTLTVLSNSPPTVTLLAAPPARFYTIDTVTMVARAQDAETAAQVFWYSDRGGLLGVGDTLRWNPAAKGGAGFHIFRIEARDPQGNRDVAVATANVLPGERFRWTTGVCAPGDPGHGQEDVVLALGDDGTIYVGGNIGVTCRGYLVALSPTRDILWSFALNSYMWEHTSAIVVAPDGGSFLFDYTGMTYGLDPAGNLRWQRQVLSLDSHGRLALSPEGALFIGGETDALVRLDPQTGAEIWSIDDPGYHCGPVLTPDRILAAQVSGRTEFYDTDGQLVGTIIRLGMAVSPFCFTVADWGGSVYTATRRGWVDAVTLQGERRWTVVLPSEQVGEPVIDAAGTVYVGVGLNGIPRRSRLLAVSASGAVDWDITLAGSQFTPRLALLADRTLWIAVGEFLHHVTTNGQRLETIELARQTTSALAVSPDGAVYVLTGDGRLLAVDGHSPLDPDAPWPVWRRDNRRTASVPH